MGLIEGVEAGSTCENSRTCRTCGTCGTCGARWTSGTRGTCGTCESCGICGACGTCAIGLSACGLGRIISTWHAHCLARTLQCPGAWCWRESQRRDREIGPDRSGCLVVMLQGAVKETPVEATLVRGVPFSIPRTWLRKMALPPDHAIFLFNGFRSSWWLLPSLPRARGCVYWSSCPPASSCRPRSWVHWRARASTSTLCAAQVGISHGSM